MFKDKRFNNKNLFHSYYYCISKQKTHVALNMSFFKYQTRVFIDTKTIKTKF